MSYRARIVLVLFVALRLSAVSHAIDAPPLLADAPAPTDFRLVGEVAADVYVDPADFEVVKLSAGLFATDVERVTGKKPKLTQAVESLSGHAVLAGTIGKSAVIDKLVADKKLDVAKVKGQWETFVIATVENPLPGVERGLIIAGSDRRGTAYGLLEVSQQIGVSPWVYWADSVPTKRATIALRSGSNVVGPPSVKYRGIFLNDEDWGLTPWAAKNLDKDLKNIGPRTYEKIFELLLRLKANYLWPAMHPVSVEFGKIEENIKLADQWAIVMGASHAEPMNRNNVHWNREGRGPWRYDTNSKSVYAYWEEWAKQRGPFEAVWTVGMRGIHDSGMGGPRDVKEQAKLLSEVIVDQRKLLGQYVNKDVASVPQAFMPYKEALTQYQAGLKVSEDVTLVWCEDNFGYLRQLSTPEEQQRPGGAGVYYHISYLGTPKAYLWLNTTPPALIWTEMHKALAYKADRIWVLNVGDIKPGEIGMEFWTKFAWNSGRYDENAQTQFLTEFATREFGAKLAPGVVEILNDYYQLGFQRKPELTEPGVFSLAQYDEAWRRAMTYQELRLRSDVLMDQVPAEKKDAFYQLIAYPVRVAAWTNVSFISADQARHAARQGRPVANGYAKAAVEAYEEIKKETDYYNKTLAGGKWDGMMPLNGWWFNNEYGGWDKKYWSIHWPTPQTFERSKEKRIGIAIDGRMVPLIDGGVGESAADIDIAIAAKDPKPPYERFAGGIGVPNGRGNAADPKSAHVLTFDFTVAKGDQYRMFAEVAAGGPDDDSFFFQIDDNPWHTWNDIAPSATPAWREHDLHLLAAGKHTLRLAAREDGAAIRSIRFTTRTTAERLSDFAETDPSDTLPTITDAAHFPSAGGSFRVYTTDGSDVGAVTVKPAAAWVRIVPLHAGVEQEFGVHVEWDKAPAGKLATTIDVTVGEVQRTLKLNAVRLPADGTFAAVDGVVSIESEHFTRATAAKATDAAGRDAAAWKVVPRLGRSGDGAVTIFPETAPSLDPADLSNAPVLEYDFVADETGKANVSVYCLPTYRIHEGRGLRYAVAIDDAKPTVVDFSETGGGSGEHGPKWLENTRRNISVSTTPHELKPGGKHTLKLYMIDPGVVVDKLVLDLGGLKPSELGPPETRKAAP